MKRIICAKLVMAAALIYLLWLSLQCPCGRLLCCHLPQFWIAIAVVVGVVFFENNGLFWNDPSCIVPFRPVGTK